MASTFADSADLASVRRGPANPVVSLGQRYVEILAEQHRHKLEPLLSELGRKSSAGSGPAYVSVDRSGSWVLVANYGGGTVAVLPILADGRLGEASDVKVDAGKIGPASELAAARSRSR